MSDSQAPAGLAIDPVRLAAWLAEKPALQVIDVREPYERDAGHIDGSRHVELNRLTGEAATIDREQPVVFYCRVGARSGMAAEAFRGSGYEAYSLDGGLVRWAAEGLPLSPEGGTVADH
jgi:rhodanese-related sulfurtransferase